MKQVKIVPMAAEHLDRLEQLERMCFSRPWSRKMLAEELDNQCAAFLVAVEPGTEKAVGYAGLLVVADEGYITNVAVDPSCRRQGVAAQLLQVFDNFAKGNHLAFLTLEVRPSNAAAIALSRRILREGEPAVKDYLGFLSGGCSADPITLLRGAGVDMASTKPVEDATALFDSLIGEMEELMK